VAVAVAVAVADRIVARLALHDENLNPGAAHA
jgi:hypothetical protein